MSRSEADVSVTEHVVKALVDGFPLALSIRRLPSNVAISNAVVIIAAATGVPAAAYVGFVDFLVSYGHIVVSFDYRLSGRSLSLHMQQVSGQQTDTISEVERVAHLRRYPDQGTYEQLAKRDYAAALLFAWKSCCVGTDRYLVTVGNSLGGQLTPIAVHAAKSVDADIRIVRCLFVSSASGHPGYAPYPDAVRYSYELLRQDIAEKGYMDSRGFGMGNSMTRAQGLDALSAVSSETWYDGHKEISREALTAFDTPCLSVLLSDDAMLVQGSARRGDALLRGMGEEPFLRETEQERRYWTGAAPIKNALDPLAYGRKPNKATLSRILLDVEHNRWLTTSTPEIGHVGWCKARVGQQNAPSRQFWQLLRAWLDDRAYIPSATDAVLGGCGGRADFGPETHDVRCKM